VSSAVTGVMGYGVNDSPALHSQVAHKVIINVFPCCLSPAITGSGSRSSRPISVFSTDLFHVSFGRPLFFPAGVHVMALSVTFSYWE